MRWLSFTSNEYFLIVCLVLNIENHNVGKYKDQTQVYLFFW